MRRVASSTARVSGMPTWHFRATSAPGPAAVELRVEAFNLFNHVNWGNPNVTVGNTNAGMITSTSGDPRIMQFAVKYQF